jgi:hypothetical protein
LPGERPWVTIIRGHAQRGILRCTNRRRGPRRNREFERSPGQDGVGAREAIAGETRGIDGTPSTITQRPSRI